MEYGQFHTYIHIGVGVFLKQAYSLNRIMTNLREMVCFHHLIVCLFLFVSCVIYEKCISQAKCWHQQEVTPQSCYRKHGTNSFVTCHRIGLPASYTKYIHMCVNIYIYICCTYYIFIYIHVIVDCLPCTNTHICIYTYTYTSWCCYCY